MRRLIRIKFTFAQRLRVLFGQSVFVDINAPGAIEVRPDTYMGLDCDMLDGWVRVSRPEVKALL